MADEPALRELLRAVGVVRAEETRLLLRLKRLREDDHREVVVERLFEELSVRDASGEAVAGGAAGDSHRQLPDLVLPIDRLYH